MSCGAPLVGEAVTPTAVFNAALRRARRQRFLATNDLSDALKAYVHCLRIHGSSCEDAIGAVGARARLISPQDRAPSDNEWEDEWRRYFALYDALIERTVRAYVLDEDADVVLAGAV